ncbi:hypothetical protein K469DRAFT_688667 [Zopfia rhizophila CBS 207.26]|uniref:Enoyl reductase (ER) domain-containing protein n=1 Tax=Zopfia rhizophila CBS 207.26 TaxID=1314779 RepID=A0A6A6E3F5_9PEZI|nr:hypothetical protein K469DRAFT_688667 [Zopfia rhizophila CBS 207.26]
MPYSQYARPISTVTAYGQLPAFSSPVQLVSFSVKISTVPVRPQNQSVTNCSLVYRMPEGVCSKTAAALSFHYVTAFYGLIELARIRQGDYVLVHVAGSGQGQAAVRVARQYDARVFATVQTVEEKRLLMTLYGLAEEDIFDAEDQSLADAIMRATKFSEVNKALETSAIMI